MRALSLLKRTLTFFRADFLSVASRLAIAHYLRRCGIEDGLVQFERWQRIWRNPLLILQSSLNLLPQS